MSAESTFSAGLTATQLSYFTTVATVIPVLFLASLVQVAAFSKGAKSTANWMAFFVAILVGLGDRTHRFVRAVAHVLVVGVAVAAMCLPAAAETAAFLALAQGHTSPIAKVLTVAGLIAGGLNVLAPLLWGILYGYWNAWGERTAAWLAAEGAGRPAGQVHGD